MMREEATGSSELRELVEFVAAGVFRAQTVEEDLEYRAGAEEQIELVNFHTWLTHEIGECIAPPRAGQNKSGMAVVMVPLFFPAIVAATTTGSDTIGGMEHARSLVALLAPRRWRQACRCRLRRRCEKAGRFGSSADRLRIDRSRPRLHGCTTGCTVVRTHMFTVVHSNIAIEMLDRRRLVLATMVA